MKPKNIIYIDQNIIQYVYEGKLELNLDDSITWAYSDEHFGEINRHDDEIQCFNVLEHLKAQKINIQLDDNFKITDRCFLYDYEDPQVLYKEYLNAIENYKHLSSQFLPLQTLFFGNTRSFDVDNYIEQFKTNLSSLTSDINADNDSLSKLYNSCVETVAEQLKGSLVNAQNQIQPLDKIRKSITIIQLSDLDHINGSIIEQIWSLIQVDFEKASISKDQLFGKEKLPFFDSTENKQTIFEGIVQCHTLLNYLGYWPDDKLTRPSKIFGINSDASHIAHGFFCNGILSADDRFCRKARAIYEYYGKTDNVLQVVFEKNKNVL